MTEARQLADAELVTRTRQGDEEAFRVLCERHAPQLRTHARRLLSPAVLRKVSVADILQDAFLTAFQHITDFEDRGPGSFQRWLTGVVDNRVRHTARLYTGTAKRGPEVSRNARCETANFEGHAPSPSQMAIAGELRERIDRVMATLPADYREVLRLRQQHHLTLEQTAQRMGRSKDAVNKLYARAVARLTQALGLEEGA